MGFTTGDLPAVDPETFADRPLFERIRILSTHWLEYGFGTPKMVHAIYVVKLLVLYVCGGLFVATATSGLGPFWQVASYWTEPIVYEKLIIWTVLLETLGFAGSWGPLAGHFKPMTGGVLHWGRPDTIRLPPWPERVPFTGGDRRSIVDVALYLAIIATTVVALVAPSVSRGQIVLVRPTILLVLIGLLVVMGLRDKIVFLAARSEQYVPAMVFFATLGYVDLIVALKLLIVAVWVGAGISKFGRHFTRVVVPMVSNTPWMPKALKRRNVRSFPDDLRPSHAASLLAHVGGSTVEILLPLLLLFSMNRTVTLVAVVGMVIFHLFILSTFPLAVPLEWNALFAFATVFLFWGHPAWQGFAVADFSSPVVLVAIVGGLLFFPVLGNLRPDLVSFLPSMRQYAGNWASAMWAFAPGAEAKLDRITRAAGNTVDQVAATYPRPVAEMLLTMPIAWRSMHSQGPALLSMFVKHLGDDIHRYSLREAEFGCNTVVGFNFGDGHFHDEQLIEAIQKRCRFEPGEFLVAWVESQPIHKDHQEYKVIDAALGVVERGTYLVADAVAELPWMPDGPIPLNVTWTRSPLATAAVVAERESVGVHQ
ncbi:MAG TPA: DUF3556 domain-containing protein [Acidimicrobiales bacterium]|nr:DUF3556 domain-containing protein [Acidimicrobiales bacterium]